MLTLNPLPQVKGSPVFRVAAKLEGRPVGTLWCFTNEAEDGETASRWFFRTADGSLYGYRNGPLAYNACVMVLEDIEITKGTKND